MFFFNCFFNENWGFILILLIVFFLLLFFVVRIEFLFICLEIFFFFGLLIFFFLFFEEVFKILEEILEVFCWFLLKFMVFEFEIILIVKDIKILLIRRREIVKNFGNY